MKHDAHKKIFTRIDDVVWASIANRIPNSVDQTSLRCGVEHALQRYSVSVGLIEEPYLDEAHVSQIHLKFAAAGRALIAAYGWEMFPFPMSERERRIRLVEELAFLAERSERLAADYLGSRRRGPSTDSRTALSLDLLIGDLCEIWISAGGKIGASASSANGGPLLRTIAAASSMVMENPPTTGQVRGWIRKWKSKKGGEV